MKIKDSLRVRKDGKFKILNFAVWFLLFTFHLLLMTSYAYYTPEVAQTSQASEEPQPEPAAQESQEPQKEYPVQTAIVENLTASSNVTLDFKEADIRNVLKIISYKAGVNIVTTPEVIGNVTIRLVDVPWEKALDVILKTYGFSYEKQANIIMVAPIEKLTAQKKQEVELAQVQPTATEVFNLKYIDAQDAKKALDPQLSARGKITVLEMTGQAGWAFGGTELGKRQRVEEKKARSKVLIVSDVPPVLDKIREVVDELDRMPLQVLIEARLMEVSTDRLKDIGFDWGTGSGGAESSTITTTPTAKRAGANITEAGGHMLGNQITPSVFGPKESTALTTANTGLKVLFKRLSGAQFEVLLHALDEDVHTNTLSAPRIMTLNNQEATILVGTKYPILKTDTTGAGSTAITNVTLDYYQDIGIQLNVVPQIGQNNYINMVIHPAVSSFTSTDTSITSAKYPIIDIREAETRILMKDGETAVIGGLLKDIKSKEIIGVPFLSKVPVLGIFFKRETIDTQKIDLLIFITARIIKEGEFTPEEIAKLEERVGMGSKKAVTKKKKK